MIELTLIPWDGDHRATSQWEATSVLARATLNGGTIAYEELWIRLDGTKDPSEEGGADKWLLVNGGFGDFLSVTLTGVPDWQAEKIPLADRLWEDPDAPWDAGELRLHVRRVTYEHGTEA